MAKSPDQRILELAQRNHGAVTARQLAAERVSATTISRRVSSGFLVPVVRGVYIVGVLESPMALVAAVQLAVPDAVASHRTAARLHGMSIFEPKPELTRRGGSHLRVPGVRIHESKRLDAVDLTEIDGLKVTTAARTLWDLAAPMGEYLHRTMVQTQVTIKRPTRAELIACHRSMARQGRKGTVAMRLILLELFDDEPFPASELERRVQDELDRRGAPLLRRQFKPPWYDGVRGIVDFADPIGKTIIEADGRRWHASEQARRSDLQRDLIAAKNGWVVLRVGWHEVVHRTDPIMNDIVALILSRRLAAQAQS